MTQERNRDKAMEPLLKHTLARASEQAAAGAEACPEPEILAAYFDRSLGASEIERWENHFSVCARCQQQLAGLAASEPGLEARPHAAPQPTPEKMRAEASRWAWLWDWRWLAPAAAAVAALALWVAIRPTSPRLEPHVAQVQSEREAAPAKARDEALHRMRAAAPTAVAPPAAAGARADVPTKKDLVAQRTVPLEEKPKGAVVAAAEEAREVTLAQKAGAPQVAQAPVQVPQTVEKGRAGVVGGVVEYKAEQRAEQDKMAPQQAVVVERGAPVAAEAARAEARQAELQAPAERVEALRSRSMSKALEAPEVRVATPNPAILWRLTPGGRIERTTDSGKTWEVQESGVRVHLLAGAAPSTTVCWVVGRAGTVLLSTDGKRWEKLASPTQADLVRIDARDALHAIVAAADGRSYQTTDGGRTWHLR